MSQQITIPHTITLQHPLPVTKNGKAAEPISEVTVKRLPTLDDLIALEGLTPYKQQRRGLELLTDLGPHVGKLRAPDFFALSAVVGPLFTVPDEEDSPDDSGDSDASQ